MLLLLSETRRNYFLIAFVNDVTVRMEFMLKGTTIEEGVKIEELHPLKV